MYKKICLIVILSILVTLFTSADQLPKTQNSLDFQPSYIDELVDNTNLTQDHVNKMRKDGQSWGNIRINARMAEQIAAQNPDSGITNQQKYEAALSYVQAQRAAGKGLGNIANENNFKLGSVIGKGKGTQNKQKTQVQSQNQTQVKIQIQTQTQTKVKKQGFSGDSLVYLV